MSGASFSFVRALGQNFFSFYGKGVFFGRGRFFCFVSVRLFAGSLHTHTFRVHGGTIFKAFRVFFLGGFYDSRGQFCGDRMLRDRAGNGRMQEGAGGGVSDGGRGWGARGREPPETEGGGPFL